MFKVVSNRTFTRKITVMTPNDDGGFDTETFKAKYNYLPTEEAKAFDLKTAEGTTDFLRRVIVEMYELTDEKRNPIEYNDHVREAVIYMPNVRQALVVEYLEGVTKSKSGN